MSTSNSFRDRLVGAWELVTYVVYSERTPQKALYPLGEDAKGMILYTPDGCMSAQLQRPGQKAFDAASPIDGSESELAESAKNFIGYSGRYEIDDSGPELVLIHHFFVSSFPNWIGDAQRRIARLDGIGLVLSLETPVEMKGERWIPKLTWRRAANDQGS